MNTMSLYTRQAGKEFQQFKQIIEEFCANEENEQTAMFNTHRAVIYMFNKKALDQHDLEIRAEERKKVCEELKSSQNKLAIEKLEDIKNYFLKIGADLIDDGQIHLIEIMVAELKGEKDE